MKENYILTIKAENRPGLLHLITGILNRKLIKIISVSAAPTDIHDIVMITLEIQISEKALQPLLFKLENIIEVFAAEAIVYQKAVCLRAAYFKMAKSFIESEKKTVLQKYNAIITDWCQDSITIAKCGTDAEIRAVYNQLEGPDLLGFSQTGVIANSNLIAGEQSLVISLAA